jgi:uncharacterized protein (TIGR02246 family)
LKDPPTAVGGIAEKIFHIGRFCFPLSLLEVSGDGATKRRKMMKTLVFVTLLMLGFSGQAVDSTSADEAAMRESVKQMETGWNKKSGALFAKPFAEDADYVVINGMYIKGRAVIESQHQRIFDTIFKDTTLSLTVKQIRFLRPDVAVVHVSGQRVGPARENNQEAIITLVMTKSKDGWLIAAFQNTAVAPRV